MAKIDDVKTKLLELIDKSNATTGNADTDLTTAVDALVEGYGKGGSTVEMQEKTVNVTENGTTEVLPDEGFALSKVTVNTNVASVGDAPKLNAPTLNLALSNLLIEAADNGSFDDGYRLYIDGVQVAELAITKTTVDLTTYITEEGDYTISVVCYGDGFEDSDEVSVAFSYVVRGVSFVGEVGTLDIYQSYATIRSGNIDKKVAIFTSGTDYYDYANSCDDEFTVSSITAPNRTRWSCASSLKNYVLYAGGAGGNPRNAHNRVTAYDINATLSSLDSMENAMCDLQSACAENLAIFAYGRSSPTSTGADYIVNVVESYDDDLVRHSPTSLSVARTFGKAGSSKSLAIFYGGTTNGSYSGQSGVIDAFDKDLTRTSAETTVSIYTSSGNYTTNSAGKVGDYALFVNGYWDDRERNYVVAIDDNLTRKSVTNTGDNRETVVVTVGDYAICPVSGKTAIYDIALTKTENVNTVYAYAGTCVGDYGLYYNGAVLKAYQAK